MQVSILSAESILVSWSPSRYKACCPVLAYVVNILDKDDNGKSEMLSVCYCTGMEIGKNFPGAKRAHRFEILVARTKI